MNNGSTHQVKLRESATATGVVLPKYLPYLRVAPHGPTFQCADALAVLRVVQRFTERKPRTV